jgi:hypothetical protein
MPSQVSDNDQEDTEIERQRRLRRESQRRRHSNETSSDRYNRRKRDPNARQIEIGREDKTRRADHRNAINNSATIPWWDHIAILNTSQTTKPLGLDWNRSCKPCGIKVSHPFAQFYLFLFINGFRKALTGYLSESLPHNFPYFFSQASPLVDRNALISQYLKTGGEKMGSPCAYMLRKMGLFGCSRPLFRLEMQQECGQSGQ